MRKQFKLGMALGAAVFGIAAVKPVQAAIVNAGFEASPDFSGWTTAGAAAIQDSTFRVPAEGALQAVMTTGTPSAIGDSNNPVTAANLNTFLGLSGAGLTGLGATEGSAIKQISVTGNAGDTISFKYDFFTTESRVTSFNDFAFVVIDGVVTKLADVNSINFPNSAAPAITGSGDNAGINSYLGVAGKETGFLTGSVTLAAGGTHTIGFGVVDVGDTGGASGLIVDALVQAPGTGGGGGGGGGSGVPLPAGMYLMPLGLAVAKLYSVKVRRAAAC